MPDSGDSERGRSRRRLARLVASFLGVPQPGHYSRQQELQDELLPRFLENARLSWLLSEPHQADLRCAYTYLGSGTQAEMSGDQIRRLKKVLEEMRVLDLLEAAADSPDLPALLNVRPAYEVRLLNQAGHPRASDEFPALMRKVVANPTILAEARQTLDQAVVAAHNAHLNISKFTSPQPGPKPRTKAAQAKAVQALVEQQPKKRKLFGGLGSLFSGLVLLAGDGAAPAIVAPVAGPLISLLYLPLVGSFAGGIAAVGKGVGDLRGEG